MEKNYMNILYEDYQNRIISKTQFEEGIFKRLLSHSSFYGILEQSKENNSDFISWIYPRLSSTLERYSPRRGISFDTYLHRIIRLMYKEYKTTERRRRETELIYWNVSATEAAACCEEEAAYQIVPKFDEKTKRLSQRQLLLLLLKSYYFMTENYIAALSPFIDYNQEAIVKMIDELRIMRNMNDMKRRALRDRCFTQHFRCLTVQSKLSIMEKDCAAYPRLVRQLQRSRLRLGRMRLRLKMMRPDATNKQIAQVMGLPKGSVDSMVSVLRRNFKKEPNEMK